jgi:hypothetical protein
VARLNANYADVARAIAKLAQDNLHGSQSRLTAEELDSVAKAVRDAAYTWLNAQVDALRGTDASTRSAAKEFVAMQRRVSTALGTPKKMRAYSDFVERYNSATAIGKKRLVTKESAKAVKFAWQPKSDQEAISCIVQLIDALIARAGKRSWVAKTGTKILTPLKMLPVVPIDTDYIVQAWATNEDFSRFIDIRLHDDGLFLRIDATGSEEGDAYAIPLLNYGMTKHDSGFSSNEIDIEDALTFVKEITAMIRSSKTSVTTQLLGESFEPTVAKKQAPKKGTTLKKRSSRK